MARPQTRTRDGERSVQHKARKIRIFPRDPKAWKVVPRRARKGLSNRRTKPPLNNSSKYQLRALMTISSKKKCIPWDNCQKYALSDCLNMSTFFTNWLAGYSMVSQQAYTCDHKVDSVVKQRGITGIVAKPAVRSCLVSRYVSASVCLCNLVQQSWTVCRSSLASHCSQHCEWA